MNKSKSLIVGFLILVLISITLVPVQAQEAQRWKTTVKKDEMTGEKRAYAVGPMVSPTEKLGFPYWNLKAGLRVGYDGADKWVYVYFNTVPNLDNNDVYTYTRIKWDDEIKNDIELSHEQGSKYIHFTGHEKRIILRIKKSDTMLLELDWFGEGEVYFRFPLDGAKDAINKMTYNYY